MDVKTLARNYAQKYGVEYVDAGQELNTASGGVVTGQEVTFKFRLTQSQLGKLHQCCHSNVEYYLGANNVVVFSASKGLDVEKVLACL